MFGKINLKKKDLPPLHDGYAVGRDWNAPDKGTGRESKPKPDVVFSSQSGGVPFHAAVKFKFDIGNSGKPESRRKGK